MDLHTPFTGHALVVNIMTPGGYELGIGLMAGPTFCRSGSDLQDEKYWIVLCQVVFGALALMILPASSTLPSLSGMLGEMMVDYDI